jgi:hypothetical protein
VNGFIYTRFASWGALSIEHAGLIERESTFPSNFPPLCFILKEPSLCPLVLFTSVVLRWKWVWTVVEWSWQDKTDYPENNTFPSAISSTTNLTRVCPSWNRGLHNGSGLSHPPAPLCFLQHAWRETHPQLLQAYSTATCKCSAQSQGAASSFN